MSVAGEKITPMTKKAILTVAVGIMAVAVTPATAHADDQGFVDDINAAGMPRLALSDGELLLQDYDMCSKMRNGAGREAIKGGFNPLVGGWSDAMIDAAQHQLCPDTL